MKKLLIGKKKRVKRKRENKVVFVGSFICLPFVFLLVFVLYRFCQLTGNSLVSNSAKSLHHYCAEQHTTVETYFILLYVYTLSYVLRHPITKHFFSEWFLFNNGLLVRKIRDTFRAELYFCREALKLT